ncbi:MAG: hypothetical protein ACTHYX_05765 [Psychrobacter sp.]|uniref:hypothetical protein n=1 Tax=Psychrobacter sp. TaxID=56811 RepID=UPI0026491AEB|nr:hypothetical protein [Psychrobacter sp.]MDN6275447.1 hypothetical protein [Psychrobacter sp.]MDN6307807.1 hypothetical protein [Psychrobacter sp.]
MSVATYQSHLNTTPKKYQLLKLFRPPIYIIGLSNNQVSAVCYYKDGSSKRHQVNANFSNRRMVVADFLLAVQAITDLLLKFPKHPFGVSGLAAVNVTEELAGGLTMIEIKAITEAVWAASGQAKRRIVSSTISYQGQPVAVNE